MNDSRHTHDAPGTDPLTPLALHALLALAESPRHGYGIILDIEERTAGRLQVRSGTLYAALQRLEQGGLIRDAGVVDADPRRRRHYELTDDGRRAIQHEAERLADLLRTARERRVYRTS